MSSLRGKIMSGYVAITALTLIMATWSALSNVNLSGGLNEMMVQNYRSVLASANMLAALERQDSWALLSILGEPTAADPYEMARADFLAWFARAEDNITLPNEGQAISSIRESYLRYTAGVDTIARRVWSGAASTAEARDSYVATALPDFEATRVACFQLLTMNDEAMRAVQDRTTRATKAAALTTGLVAVAALMVALIASYTVSERITRPVRRLAESADRIARGHLDEEIVLSGSDEVSILAREFSAMLDHLRALRASDIAAVMASRSKLESVIEAISDGIVVFGPAGLIEVVNPSARRILGLDGQDVVGQKLIDVANDPRLRSLVENIDDPTASQAGATPIDIQLTTGEPSFFLAELLSVWNAGDVIARVLLLRDVTIVEKNERAKSQFMSAVSHELRTPLTSMTMSIGLLGESAVVRESERAAGLVEILRDDAARMSRLVDDLFEISRLQRGQLPMDFRPANLHELADNALDLFRTQAEAQGIGLSVEFPEDLPIVLIDQEKIAWVISNLVGNALRYTDSGGKILVSASRQGSKVYVSVADTGRGIPKDRQEAIFEPYVQLSGGTKGGAGLGLAISRDVVRAHGGRIWVESELEQGSTFTFSVPVAH